MSITLRIMGFFSLLSGVQSEGGNGKRLLALLVRFCTLMAWSVIVVFLINGWTVSYINPERAFARIAAMTQAEFTAVSEDLDGLLLLEPVSSEARDAFGVRVRLLDPGEAELGRLRDLLAAAQELEAASENPASDAGVADAWRAYRNAYDGVIASAPPTRGTEPFICTRTGGDLCLYRVETFLAVPLVTDFKRIEFPATAYSISEVAIEVALEDEDVTFTTSKREAVRAQIESILTDGEGMFLPNESELLRGRQFNGEIQATTYLLGAWATGIMLFLFLGSRLSNSFIRRYDEIEINDTELVIGRADPRAAEGASAIAPDESTSPQSNDVEHAKSSGDRVDGGDDKEYASSYIVPSPTPWSPRFEERAALDLTDATSIAAYYQQVAQFFRERSSCLGVMVDPPILRFRTAATRALANTRDTSILPGFLEAQRETINGFYDARLSPVRFLLWAIPTIGFIGTIIGVSGALSATTNLQAARNLTAAAAQSEVAAFMGSAFDTTLVALLVAVVVMLMFYALQGAEDRMTLLERNSAEREVLEIAHLVRKPGDTVDLAQQLISLGVSAEVLEKDLRLFPGHMQAMQQAIQDLQRREREMAALIASGRTKGIRSGGWRGAFLLVILLGVGYAFFTLGGMQRLQEALDQVRGMF